MKTVGSEPQEDTNFSDEGRYQQNSSTLASSWQALALRGLVAVLFGLVVLFWPGLVFAVLALLFGLYAVVDGAITSHPRSDPRTRARKKGFLWPKGRWVPSPG
jgi:uncharacterized membrane protein HdeD (DUF308 family)